MDVGTVAGACQLSRTVRRLLTSGHRAHQGRADIAASVDQQLLQRGVVLEVTEASLPSGMALLGGASWAEARLVRTSRLITLALMAQNLFRATAILLFTVWRNGAPRKSAA
jgi:hypothetical protein